MDNRVTDGQRSITIVTTDASGAESVPITAYITVADRNDGPVVNVGGGDSMDFTVTSVENGSSIPIGIAMCVHYNIIFLVCIGNIKHGSKTIYIIVHLGVDVYLHVCTLICVHFLIN